MRQDLSCKKEEGPNFRAGPSKKETGPNLRKKGRTELPEERQDLTSGREAGPDFQKIGRTWLPEERQDLTSGREAGPYFRNRGGTLPSGRDACPYFLKIMACNNYVLSIIVLRFSLPYKVLWMNMRIVWHITVRNGLRSSEEACTQNQIHIQVYRYVFDFALCINLFVMLLGSCVKMLCEWQIINKWAPSNLTFCRWDAIG